MVRFNSRTREGCDETLLDERAVVVEVSIHAPGRGATTFGGQDIDRKEVSIHAPGRGATTSLRWS